MRRKRRIVASWIPRSPPSCARTQTSTQNLAIDKRSLSALLWTTVCVLTRIVRAVPDPWCSWQVLAHLAPEDGRTGHPIIRIGSAGVLIGRGSDAERAEAAEAGLVYVHVGPRHVSAKHCRIFKRDGKWLLQQEASSKNGIPSIVVSRGTSFRNP